MNFRNRPRGPIRYATAKSKTGIPGINLALVRIHGKAVLHYLANCGRRTRSFNAAQLGRQEALRRALRVRAAYERNWRPT